MNDLETITVPSLACPPRRILIVLHGAIGDVVRALPLLGRMRRGWPEAHIAWAVEPKSAPILERHPWLDELILYDRRRAPWSFVPFLREIRGGHFDLVVDLQRHLKSGVTSLISGAHDRIGFGSANTKEFNHRFSTIRSRRNQICAASFSSTRHSVTGWVCPQHRSSSGSRPQPKKNHARANSSRSRRVRCWG